MKLIVGLGNPGSKYDGTRHNIGRGFIDNLAARLQVKLEVKKPLKSRLTSVVWEDQEVTLATPETYMNLSGQALGALVPYCELQPEKDLLVVVDDVALPFERLRLRYQGSDGGHNGLKSIESALNTNVYARLRLGVGGSENQALEDYVLDPFEPQEAEALPGIFDRGFEACRLWLSASPQAAMGAING